MVDQLHDEIVVVAVLPVFEAEAVVLVEENIVLEGLDIIDFLYLSL